MEVIMNKSILTILALAVLVTTAFAGSGAALAWGGMHHGGGYHGGGYHRGGGPYQGGNGPYGGMTQEQQVAAQKMHAEFYAATDGLRQQIMSKEAELQAQMYSASPDSKKIEGLSREIGELQGKLMVERNKYTSRMSSEGIPAGMGYGGGYGHGGRHGGWGHGGRCFW